MSKKKLFMVLIGCTPKGRFTEQHDVFFGIADSLHDLIPAMKAFWPEANGVMHVDAWREVNQINDFAVKIEKKEKASVATHKLFFLNLGGYKAGEFDEPHYKMIVAAKDKSEAIKQSKETAFYKHNGFKGAASHVDDKYGVDVDDIYQIEDILSEEYKSQYHISITEKKGKEDEIHLGYLKLEKIKENKSY